MKNYLVKRIKPALLLRHLFVFICSRLLALFSPLTARLFVFFYSFHLSHRSLLPQTAEPASNVALHLRLSRLILSLLRSAPLTVFHLSVYISAFPAHFPASSPRGPWLSLPPALEQFLPPSLSLSPLSACTSVCTCVPAGAFPPADRRFTAPASSLR